MPKAPQAGFDGSSNSDGLDTNVLIRYFAQDDPTQTAVSTDLIENRLRSKGPGYVSLACTLEIVWVLQNIYRLTSTETARAIERMLQIEELFVQNELEVYVAMRVLLENRGSFADALIVSLGTWAGCSATLTFDKKASRLPGFTLLRPSA